jgi:hypothetical protein
MQYTIVKFFTMICQRTSCCIFHAINQMLCRLACAIGMKLDACTRWHHLCMFLPKNKMPLTWRKHVGGWPQFFVHGEFPSANGEMTPHNFEVWIIFNWQVCKCHMGWRQGCKIFLRQLNQMYKVNLEAQVIVQHVVHKLMGPPYNKTPLEKCYWRHP